MFALSPPVDGVAKGGSVVVVPAGGDTYLPDESRGRVADAYGQGGIAALQSSVEGLLGITFDVAVALPAAPLGQALGSLAPVEFNLGQPVLADTTAGTGVEAIASGPVSLDRAGIGTLLTSASSTQGETDRLPVVDAFWRAAADRIGSGIVKGLDQVATTVASAKGSDPANAPAAFDTFLRSLFAGPLQVHTLASELVTDTASNPDHLDLLRLDAGEIAQVFATIAPSAVSPPNPTISIYVRSSLADPKLTREAVVRLILAGANVVLVTENPESTPPALTEVAYVDPNDRREAESYGKYLGTFTSKLADLRIDGVDAIVTLGENFRTAATLPIPVSPATTTTIDATSTDDPPTESSTG